MSVPQSELDRVNANYRARFLAREAAATQELGRAYQNTWDAIEDRLVAIAEDTETDAAFLLFQDERYRTLQNELAIRMEVLEERVYESVLAEQRFGATQGREQALRQIQAIYGDLGREMAELNRLPIEQLSDLIGNLQDGSPLRSLLHELGPDAMARIDKSLTQGIALGLNPREVANMTRDAFGKNLSRAMTVSRTEMLRAARQSTLRHYQENSHAVTRWRWVAALDSRTCMACVMLHGRVFQLDEHPGNHPNCFIAGTVVSGPEVVGSTARWYSGPVVEVETALGHRFTVTPNHPILTSQGWVAAGLLHEGSDVVSAPFGERPFGEIDPNEYHAPSLIEDVAKTFGSAATVTTRRMPTTAMDFHGDGIGSEVQVVRTSGLLRDTLNAAVKQPALDQEFSRTDSQLQSFDRLSALDLLTKRMLATANSIMGGSDIPGVFFGRSCRHHQAVGLNEVATLDTGLLQATDDDGPRNTETIRDGLLGFSGSVALDDAVDINAKSRAIVAQDNTTLTENAVDHFLGDTITAAEFLTRYAGVIRLDKVVEVRRFPFTGHVYNLHTKGGWYIANGIVAHNCRCAMAPVPPNTRIVTEPGEAWFARQSPDMQAQMMGEKKYEAWADDRFALSDLVAESHDREWGLTRYEPSLKQLIGV